MSPGSIASARAAAGLWPLSSSGRLWGEAWRAIGGRDARHHPADLWYEEVSIAIRRWLDAPRFLGCLVDRDIQGQYWGRKRRVGGGLPIRWVGSPAEQSLPRKYKTYRRQTRGLKSGCRSHIKDAGRGDAARAGVVVVQNEASLSDRRRRFGMESPD